MTPAEKAFVMKFTEQYVDAVVENHCLKAMLQTIADQPGSELADWRAKLEELKQSDMVGNLLKPYRQILDLMRQGVELELAIESLQDLPVKGLIQ